jgi:hypothetical protein
MRPAISRVGFPPLLEQCYTRQTYDIRVLQRDAMIYDERQLEAYPALEPLRARSLLTRRLIHFSLLSIACTRSTRQNHQQTPLKTLDQASQNL